MNKERGGAKRRWRPADDTGVAGEKKDLGRLYHRRRTKSRRRNGRGLEPA